MSDEYTPTVVWQVMQDSARNGDHLMTGLSALMLVLTPVVYPAMLAMEFVGFGIAALINRSN